jgi:hypothetical protein
MGKVKGTNARKRKKRETLKENWKQVGKMYAKGSKKRWKGSLKVLSKEN